MAAASTQHTQEDIKLANIRQRIRLDPVAVIKDPDALESIATAGLEDKDPIIKSLIDAARPLGYTAKTIRQLIEDHSPISEGECCGCSGEGGKPKESMADIMVRFANETGAIFWHGPASETYVTFPVGIHMENHPVRSKVVKLWLGSLLRKSISKTPGSQALQDTMTALEGIAIEGEEHETYVRVGENEDKIYIDLGDKTWKAVEVSKDGWKIIDEPPIKFRRTNSTRPLPTPVKGGNWNDLRSLINAKDEDTWILCVAWTVQAFWPKGPFAFLSFNGEPGAGKTFMQTILKVLMDPSETNLRSPPKNEQDLMIAAKNEHVLSFDNLSGMSIFLADSLCRLSTGISFTTRMLYTDGDEAIFSARRPCIMNGIDILTHRGDLLDRTIVRDLPKISETNRVKEEKLFAAFNKACPGILGLILDATTMGLSREGEIGEPQMPRMIDFCKWVIACEPALPWKSGEFLRVYKASLDESLTNIVENDQVAQAILKYGNFSGNATELLRALNDSYKVNADKSAKSWPTAANYLSSRLKRVATALRSVGVTIEWTGKHIDITMPEKEREGNIGVYDGKINSYWGKEIEGTHAV